MSSDQLMVHWAACVISLCHALPNRDATTLLQQVDYLLGVWDGKLPVTGSAEVFINTTDGTNTAHRSKCREIEWLTVNTCFNNLVNATAARAGGWNGDDSCTA
jgi:hypothetical protein